MTCFLEIQVADKEVNFIGSDRAGLSENNRYKFWKMIFSLMNYAHLMPAIVAELNINRTTEIANSDTMFRIPISGALSSMSITIAIIAATTLRNAIAHVMKRNPIHVNPSRVPSTCD